MRSNRQETPEGIEGTQRQLRLVVDADPPLSTEPKVRHLHLVVDADPPLTDRASLDRWLDRRMHGAYLKWRDGAGRVPSEGVSDIRRNHRRPWRTTAKRLFEAALADVPFEDMEEISVLLRQYAHAARIICQRERYERYRPCGPFLRAATLMLAVGLSVATGCASASTAPVREITPPITRTDSSGWILATPPAVAP